MLKSVIFFTFLLLNPVACAPESALLPYCHQTLAERSFVVKTIRYYSDPDVRRFDIIYTDELPLGNCIIANRHSLRIGFDNTTLVTDVLIDAEMVSDDTTQNAAIQISPWRGSHSVQCNSTGRTETVSLKAFAVLSCSSNEHPSGFHASGIEIKSAQREILSLTHLREAGSLGWLIIAKTTTAKSPPAGEVKSANGTATDDDETEDGYWKLSGYQIAVIAAIVAVVVIGSVVATIAICVCRQRSHANKKTSEPSSPLMVPAEARTISSSMLPLLSHTSKSQEHCLKATMAGE